jgi:hypothetical protein
MPSCSTRAEVKGWTARSSSEDAEWSECLPSEGELAKTATVVSVVPWSTLSEDKVRDKG